jgi:hypothetical protein
MTCILTFHANLGLWVIVTSANAKNPTPNAIPVSATFATSAPKTTIVIPVNAEYPTKPQPRNSFRLTLTVTSAQPRLDTVLLAELRKQDTHPELKNISRTEFKELFKKKRIQIKGQAATPSSSLAKGSTDVDILLPAPPKA